MLTRAARSRYHSRRAHGHMVLPVPVTSPGQLERVLSVTAAEIQHDVVPLEPQQLHDHVDLAPSGLLVKRYVCVPGPYDGLSDEAVGESDRRQIPRDDLS